VRKIGPICGYKEALLHALMNVIGPTGTVVSLAFTKCFNLAKLDRDYIFDPAKSKSVAGAFSNVILNAPGAVRSRHPTNSFVAIGPEANSVVENHDENSPSYYPMDIPNLLMSDSRSSTLRVTLFIASHQFLTWLAER